MEDEAVFHLGGSVAHTALRERSLKRSLRTCREILLGLLRGQRMGDMVAIISNLNCMVGEVDREEALDKRDAFFLNSSEFGTYKR